MIINEWQLPGALNQALQRQSQADFALYLALMSPAVDEFAQFYTPNQTQLVEKPSLNEQLGVAAARSFDWQADDLARLTQAHEALLSDGLTAFRLQSLLRPLPVVIANNPQKLAADVSENLSLHTHRHLQGQQVEMQPQDPSQLYEILEQLHSEAA